ncbi:MAG: M20 family metallopeptidase, partial [Promethearchaeota archaeon]
MVQLPISIPDVVSLTQEFVRIETENDHEDRMRIYIEKLLKPFGFRFIHQQLAPGRTNLFALWEPISNVNHMEKSKLLLFSGHMDTVPGYKANHSNLAEIKDDKIFGRGTCDMKGGIAAFVTSTLSWIKANSHLNREKYPLNHGLLLGFTVDEEDGCQGVDHLDKSEEIMEIFKRVEYCILAEPTHLELHIGHRGINRYNIVFHGKAAHSSVPEQGINAIYRVTTFIQKVQDYFSNLQSVDSPLGHPKISVNTIAGGIASNVVPNRCEISIDRRYVPGEDPIEDEIILKNMAQKIDLDVEFKSDVVGWPYYIPDGPKNPILKRVSNLIPQSKINQLPAYTEADLYYRKYHIPTIILGPG